MTDDEDDFEKVNDDFEDNSEPLGSKVCSCGQPSIGEQCGFCGQDLCPDCFSSGGGFCSGKHTQEQIDAYEDELMGPPSPERIAQRKAIDELKALGILKEKSRR